MPQEKPFLAYSTNPATRYGGGFSPDGHPGYPFRDTRFVWMDKWLTGTSDHYAVPEGEIPSLLFGERLSEDDWDMLPDPVLRVPANRKRPPPPTLTDVTGGINKIVSERARQVIEALEPDNHQFHPVTIRCAVTGERLQPDMDFFYWNILCWQPLDEIVDLDEMGVVPETKLCLSGRSPDGTSITKLKSCILIHSHIPLVINLLRWTQAMGGKLVARTSNYHTDNKSAIVPNLLIVSSRMRRAFKANRLTGLGFSLEYASCD